jgi:FkbM family methyltransferase
MKFKKWLSGIYYSLKKDDSTLKSNSLCGISLKTFSGTIRETPDQDDAWFFYLAKHHSIIYDIGANVGYTALLAILQNPDRDYILVDPNPVALQRAMGNLLNNNVGFNAKYYAAFVSATNNETVKFYTLGSGAAGSMHASHAESAAAVNSFQEVSTVTLDYLYQYYNEKPDLVKIDVEGAETFVMEGARQIATATKCTFFIEMHDIKDLNMETATNKMIAWAQEMDYKVWYLKTGEELTSGATVKDRGKCHLLLQPSNKEYPFYLKGVKQGAELPTL